MKKREKFRIEKDSLGEVKVPKDALWGAQTQRALENFPISGIKFRFPFGRSFIKALGVIKFSAASANIIDFLPSSKTALGFIFFMQKFARSDSCNLKASAYLSIKK